MEREKNICIGCVHFCSNNDDGLLMGCRAFPDGIPMIIGGLYSHDKVFKGDIIYSSQDNDYVYMPSERKINRRGREIVIHQDSNPYADENGRYKPS